MLLLLLTVADTAAAGTFSKGNFSALSTKIEASSGVLTSFTWVYGFAQLKKELSCNTSVDEMRTIKGQGDTYASIQKTSREPFRDIARPNGSDSL